MKTGIELISQERFEQINKHGWKDGDGTWYLPSLAQYLILDDDDAEKESLGEFLFGSGTVVDIKWKIKFDSKSRIERLTVAGALIAAEIDRLQSIESEWKE